MRFEYVYLRAGSTIKGQCTRLSLGKFDEGTNFRELRFRFRRRKIIGSLVSCFICVSEYSCTNRQKTQGSVCYLDAFFQTRTIARENLELIFTARLCLSKKRVTAHTPRAHGEPNTVSCQPCTCAWPIQSLVNNSVHSLARILWGPLCYICSGFPLPC